MDCLVVGCGLSGAVIARELAEQGTKVVIWDRRKHIGGNMYDYVDEHGILVHKYGPHTFHTQKKELFDYICRFAQWEPYKLTCMAKIKDKFTPTPFNFQTIDDFYPEDKAVELKQHIYDYFGNRDTATVVEALECSDKMIRGYAEFLFKNDYSLYTAKQWGIAPEKVDLSILKRVPLRFSYDIGYFSDEYQVMPKLLYVDFFRCLLDHPNIEVQLEVEALKRIRVAENDQYILLDGEPFEKNLVYTGAIDELFELSYGALPYRSLQFEWKYEDIDSKQDAPVVAYPAAQRFTRITEYKKLPVQNVQGTTYAIEYPLQYEPGTKQEPYYPLLTYESKRNANMYQARVAKLKNLYTCGRLADFKYYNMDQALERALDVAKNIINK